MELRTIPLALDFAGGEYHYQVCTKQLLGICFKKEWVKDKFDLNDPETRKMLYNKGFVLKVREKP